MNRRGTSHWLCFSTLCATGWFLASLTANTGVAGQLIRAATARQHGLERAWFAQVGVDPTRSRIVDWKLHNDRLYSLSSAGTLQALDAETGETLWVTRVGTPQSEFVGMGVDDRYVALVSGTYLHLVDTQRGNVRITRRLGSAPAAAPVLSETYVFAALINGVMEGYPLEEDSLNEIWYHQSIGRIFYAPTIAGNVVTWPTDRGFLYVAQADQPRVLYRVETGAEIVAPPAELAPYLYVTSRDGYLYCVYQPTGVELWRWSTGYPIISKPAAVASTAYVASEEPALHALHFKSGRPKWAATGVTQFVAEGAKQVYGLDRFGNLLILEKETGGLLGRLSAAEGTQALVNDQSDRIYLVSDRGLVQCLRETDSVEPTYYRQQPVDEEAEEDEPDVDPFAAQPADDDFVEPEPEPDDSPFGARDDEATEEGDDNNPFF